MEPQYETYCLVDRDFFDAPYRVEGEGHDFGITDRVLPPGWERVVFGDWLMCQPQNVEMPAQGWKIHASSCPDNADQILEAVLEFCVPRGVPFKYLRGRHIHRNRNLKYAARGHSGKLVTIYPVDEEQFREILEGIDEVVGGEPGPYILSDLRWSAGPLYVRYGGFSSRHVVSEKGVLEPAIEDPDGNLVPDRRSPSFTLPSWVDLPDFLAPHLAARGQESLADVPYEVLRALHFSNGGGVYVAEDTRTGREVVLKEARPYAGLSFDGKDAVTRLRAERDILQRLAGLDEVPEFLDYFSVGGHAFLVQEYVTGTPLNKMMSATAPDTSARVDGNASEKVTEYTEWAIDICRRVETAVTSLHRRGVVFGDLHPLNVMVRPDGRVCLIDFEVAAPAETVERPPLGNPAFFAPQDRKGFGVDQYALACLRLAVFMPLTTLLMRDPGKAVELGDFVAGRFPVPRGFVDSAVREILGGKTGGTPKTPPRPSADPARWSEVRDSMARALLASATPERDDRLFPGDIAQFGSSGGINLAHGAAGVLYALDVTGAGRSPAHEEWLIERATRGLPQARLGFYDGLHGVAHVLDHLGHRHEALRLLDICLSERWERLGSDLYSGLAGIGLNLLHMADTTGDTALRDVAFHMADTLAGRLGGETDVGEVSGGRHPSAGLIRGSAGSALLFLRIHELIGDEGFLDLASTALRQDLRRCLVRDNGVLHVNEGWRSLPYLATGSAGIGLVLDRYLSHRADDGFADALERARHASQAAFYIQPNLFNGRAGTLLHLVATSPFERASDDPEVAAQIPLLSWHALDHEGHLAFPGEQLLRLSMDLATGTAGILLSLGAALHDTPVHLPFLGPAERPACTPPEDSLR